MIDAIAVLMSNIMILPVSKRRVSVSSITITPNIQTAKKLIRMIPIIDASPLNVSDIKNEPMPNIVMNVGIFI